MQQEFIIDLTYSYTTFWCQSVNGKPENSAKAEKEQSRTFKIVN